MKPQHFPPRQDIHIDLFGTKVPVGKQQCGASGNDEAPPVVENGQKFHKFFGTLNQGVPKIDNPQFCQARSSVRELPGFERWLHHLLLWGFTLSSHSWFTCCIDLIFQEENMKNRKQFFFARKTLGHQKTKWQNLGAIFVTSRKFFALGVLFFFSKFCGQPASWRLFLNHLAAWAFVGIRYDPRWMACPEKRYV